ncbi:MAG: tetratricopeptide repeat protein [Lewinellaceae bacterium]|nr:tetratricopeptide repeat protein [Lewinellaceae bacterium]
MIRSNALVEHFRQAIDALAAMEGQNLLVIDNAPEAAAAYLEELSKLEHWRILFTSRAAIPNTATFRLDTLTPEEATQLYERIYEKPAQSEPLDTILNDIGYHTLTIELLAAYARDKKLEPPALLDLLRQKGLARLDDYEVNTPRSAKTQDIAAHLRDVFLLELDAAEQEILRNCCILPTSNVPLDPDLVSEDRLCDLFGKKEGETDFKKRLRRLARMNWLVESQGGYRCHPVIAETAKAQLLPDAVNCGVLIKNVTRLLIPDKETNEPGIKRAPFAPLAEAVFKGVWKEKGDFEEADQAKRKIGVWLDNLFSNTGNNHKSLEYNQKALSIWEKVLPMDHPDLAISYNNLSSTYGALGEHQKSLEYHEKALAIREKVLPGIILIWHVRSTTWRQHYGAWAIFGKFGIQRKSPFHLGKSVAGGSS